MSQRNLRGFLTATWLSHYKACPTRLSVTLTCSSEILTRSCLDLSSSVTISDCGGGIDHRNLWGCREEPAQVEARHVDVLVSLEHDSHGVVR